MIILDESLHASGSIIRRNDWAAYGMTCGKGVESGYIGNTNACKQSYEEQLKIYRIIKDNEDISTAELSRVAGVSYMGARTYKKNYLKMKEVYYG